MRDKFTRGFIAGVTSGLVANIASLLFGLLGLTTLRFADWTAIIVLGQTPPFSTAEILFALAVNIGFTGILGIVFIYLVPLIKITNLLFKGWLFSTFIWFFIYVVASLFKVEGTMSIPLTTALANVATTSIYGLVLAQVSEKEFVKNIASEQAGNVFRLIKPAMKPLKKKDDDPE